MHARAINLKTLLIAAALAMLLLIGAGVAYATGDSGEQQATGPGIEKAKSVALEQTNGGRVTGTEVGDEEGYYEVEVTLSDGRQVDVHLDQAFKVLSTLGGRASSTAANLVSLLGASVTLHRLLLRQGKSPPRCPRRSGHAPGVPGLARPSLPAHPVS